MTSIPSSRILLDVPCRVCQDHSSGKHYGIFSCDGCAGFFKRSIRRHRQYVCKNAGSSEEGRCLVDKTHRNQCRACRLTKCVEIGMNREAVQHERGPRSGTRARITSTSHSTTSDSKMGALSLLPHFPLSAFFNPSSSPLDYSSSSSPIAEVAARMFFEIVAWSREQLTFITLSPQEQATSLQSSWPTLFVLHCVENKSLSKCQLAKEAERNGEGKEVVCAFERVEGLSLDHNEMKLVKLIAVHRSRVPSGGTLYIQLAAYQQVMHPRDPHRFLQTIEMLAGPSEESLISLCFRTCIGLSSMHRLIEATFNPFGALSSLSPSVTTEPIDEDTSPSSSPMQE